MTYQEAVALAATEFELKRDTSHTTLVLTGLTYDGCNGFCVMIYDMGDHAVVTDIGETKEHFDEVTEEEWKDLCASHGFAFNHWRIERDIRSTQDIYDFIEFLDFVSDKFYE